MRTTIQFSAVPSCSFQLICTFIFETEQYVGRCIARLMMVIKDLLGQQVYQYPCLVGQFRYLFQKMFQKITLLGKASSVAK